jgi:hypothetical protein
MTDAAPADPRPVQGAPSRPSLLAPSDRMKRRNAAEARFRAYGLIAISTAGALLVVLLWNILAAGLPAFQRTVVTVDFTLTEDQFDAAESVLFKTREYETYFIAALSDQLRDRGLDLEFDSASVERLLGKVGATLRGHYRDNPDAIGQPVRFELPTSSRVERYFKGGFARADIGDANRFITAGDLDLADALKQAGVLRTAFNWTFVTGVDTGSDNPGGAGIGASVVGSFFMMLVVLVAGAADRRGGLDLSRGVRAAEPVHRPHRGQHLEPRRGAVDRVRHPRPCGVHPVRRRATGNPGAQGVGAAGRRAGADADDAADDHHRHPRRAEIGAALDPRGGAGRRRVEDAGGLSPRAAAGDARHPDRRDHRAGAGAGRDRAAPVADRHGRVHRPTIAEPSWAGSRAPIRPCRRRSTTGPPAPTPPSSKSTWGGIIVLLLFMLTMNLIAIILRKPLRAPLVDGAQPM